jgi:hypothetical protein
MPLGVHMLVTYLGLLLVWFSRVHLMVLVGSEQLGFRALPDWAFGHM